MKSNEERIDQNASYAADIAIQDTNLLALLREHAVSANHCIQDQQIINQYIVMKKREKSEDPNVIRERAISLYNAGPMAFRFEFGTLIRGPGNRSCQTCGYVNHVRVSTCRGCNGAFLPSKPKVEGESEPKWSQKCRSCGLPRKGHTCPGELDDFLNQQEVRLDKPTALKKSPVKRKSQQVKLISLASPPVFTPIPERPGKRTKIQRKKELDLCQRLLQDADAFSACLNKRIGELRHELGEIH